MYDKFGEMTVPELNALAENLANEGDEASLRALAKENGIPEEYADAYCSGETMELVDVTTAAIAKIDMEAEVLNLKELMADWAEYIRTLCMEENFALAVKSKEKHLKDCIAKLLIYAFSCMTEVEKPILDAAKKENPKMRAGRVTFGVPGMATAKRLIWEYYMEDQA